MKKSSEHKNISGIVQTDKHQSQDIWWNEQWLFFLKNHLSAKQPKIQSLLQTCFQFAVLITNLWKRLCIKLKFKHNLIFFNYNTSGKSSQLIFVWIPQRLGVIRSSTKSLIQEIPTLKMNCKTRTDWLILSYHS